MPLRILGLGLGADQVVEADVFLLTDDRPDLLPGGPGLTLGRSEAATQPLLNDLRSDKGMEWVPEEMWLSYLQLEAPAGDLDYDLAISTTDGRAPSTVDAGIELLGDAGRIVDGRGRHFWPVGVSLAIGLGLATGIAVMVWRRRAVRPKEVAT